MNQECEVETQMNYRNCPQICSDMLAQMPNTRNRRVVSVPTNEKQAAADLAQLAVGKEALL